MQSPVIQRPLHCFKILELTDRLADGYSTGMDGCNPQIRIWIEEELEKARTGSDLWLTTLLLNANTLSEAMSKAYPYRLRRTYVVLVEGESYPDVSAPNDKMAMRFVNSQYVVGANIELFERVVELRFVSSYNDGEWETPVVLTDCDAPEVKSL